MDMQPAQPDGHAATTNHTVVLNVFDTFGLLEHILSFCSVEEWIASSKVSRRWKEAGRMDFLWKRASEQLWVDKVGAPAQDEVRLQMAFASDVHK